MYVLRTRLVMHTYKERNSPASGKNFVKRNSISEPPLRAPLFSVRSRGKRRFPSSFLSYSIITQFREDISTRSISADMSRIFPSASIILGRSTPKNIFIFDNIIVVHFCVPTVRKREERKKKRDRGDLPQKVIIC